MADDVAPLAAQKIQRQYPPILHQSGMLAIKIE